MRNVLLVVVTAAALVSTSGIASAKGCASGAAVGGVAGHVAGHHALLGAVAGCAINHHRNAVKDAKATPALSQAQTPATPAAPVKSN